MKHTLLLLIALGLSFSATITVNSTADNTNNDGQCTLREAIQNANANSNTNTDCTAGSGNDTIVFATNLDGQTITLSAPLPITLGLNNNLTIDGGTLKITISGGGSVQLFNLSNSNNGTGTLELKNLNLIRGSATNGSVVSVGANQIFKLSNCFVGYNSATGNGTIYNDGGTVEILNCTFSGNSASSGSVIYNNSGTANLSFVTSAYNTAGVPLHGAGGNLFVKNSIFVQPPSDNICNGTVTGFGVVYATSISNCTNFAQKKAEELALGTLDYHGGNTRVYSLNPGSHAIDAITDCTDIFGNPVTKDQRGKDRNRGGNRCDAGAFEFILTEEPPSPPEQKTTQTPNGVVMAQSDAVILSFESLETNPASLGIVPPPGYRATYGFLKIRVRTTTGSATIRLIYPKTIPPGSMVYKVVGQNVYDITSQVSIRGSTITFIIADNSIYDANNITGIIEDPILLLENQNPPTGSGGGGCSTGAVGYAWLSLIPALAFLRRFIRR